MDDERIPVPDGWRDTTLVSDDLAEQELHPSAVFEHDVRDIAVHVRTNEPGTGESTDWEVGVFFGDSENIGDVEPVRRGVSDRATAISLAKELMETFNRAGVPDSPDAFDPDALDLEGRDRA